MLVMTREPVPEIYNFMFSNKVKKFCFEVEFLRLGENDTQSQKLPAFISALSFSWYHFKTRFVTSTHPHPLISPSS